MKSKEPSDAFPLLFGRGFVSQSIAKVNINEDVIQLCRTPNFIVNLFVEFPALREKNWKIWIHF